MAFWDLDTPAALVDVDVLEQNIAAGASAAQAGGKSLRPHIKTHKCVEIARMQVAAGACGLTVAKLGEAEVFADAGFRDLFVANEVVGAAKVDRLAALAGRADMTLGTDSVECSEGLAEAGRRAGRPLRVRVEVDTGHHRGGVRSVGEAARLGEWIAGCADLVLDGVFTHEGHAYEADPVARRAKCEAAARLMVAMAEALKPYAKGPLAVSVGSTPGFGVMVRQAGVTEVRPGVYVFNDAMQQGYGGSRADCALTVLATVVSRPDGRTALLDAGTKALSGDRGPDAARHGTVVEYPDARFDWASEEHGHLDLSGATSKPRIGEKVRIIPWHACGTSNMHEAFYAVRGDAVVDEWRVAARGRIR